MLSLDLFPEKKNANLTLFRFRCLILDCAVVESIIFVSVKKQSKQTDSLWLVTFITLGRCLGEITLGGSLSFLEVIRFM